MKMGIASIIVSHTTGIFLLMLTNPSFKKRVSSKPGQNKGVQYEEYCSMSRIKKYEQSLTFYHLNIPLSLAVNWEHNIVTQLNTFGDISSQCHLTRQQADVLFALLEKWPEMCSYKEILQAFYGQIRGGNLFEKWMRTNSLNSNLHLVRDELRTMKMLLQPLHIDFGAVLQTGFVLLPQSSQPKLLSKYAFRV